MKQLKQSFLVKQKKEQYHKFCRRLQKKWTQRTWHLLSPKEQTHWLQRLHHYENQLQKLGIATTFSLILLTAQPSPLQAQAPNPNGIEFLVNTHTTNPQQIPSVGMDSDGDFAITWTSQNQDGSSYGVYAQRYDNNGTPQGGEFLVNTNTNRTQNSSSIGMDSDGDFVIAWQSDFADGSYYNIYAQRYNSIGTPQGGEFLVNTHTTNNQNSPSVGMDSDGDFVITWRSHDQDGDSWGIYAQRYNNTGTPQGGEFLVNTHTTNRQNFPSVGMDSDGDFVITWRSRDQDGDSYGVYAQRYNNIGTPQGGEFLVNTHTTNSQNSPSVGMDSDGNFVIAWISEYQDGDQFGIYAQRYNSIGTPQGGDFLINTHTTDNQRFPNVGMDSDGDFVIAWQSYSQDGYSDGIYAQGYDKSGNAQGTEFLVNTHTTNRQRFPSVGMDNDGDFVIVWQSDGQDGSSEGIYAQRYNPAANPEVPTLSEWGLLNLALLFIICGTLSLLQPNWRQELEE